MNPAKKIVRTVLNTAKRVISKLERRLFRTAHQETVGRWFADGGDARFRFDDPLAENCSTSGILGPVVE